MNSPEFGDTSNLLDEHSGIGSASRVRGKETGTSRDRPMGTPYSNRERGIPDVLKGSVRTLRVVQKRVR
eukprot:1185017-Amphidinium_carterae.2